MSNKNSKKPNFIFFDIFYKEDLVINFINDRKYKCFLKKNPHIAIIII